MFGLIIGLFYNNLKKRVVDEVLYLVNVQFIVYLYTLIKVNLIFICFFNTNELVLDFS